MNTDSEIDDYGLGWAFFKMDGVRGGAFLPLESDNLVEWMKGFMAAQAEYDYPRQYASVEQALIDYDAEGRLLALLLDAADTAINTTEEWLRLPNVPVRGRARLKVV